MILIRYALIGLIVYLVVRSFILWAEGDKRSAAGPEPENKNKDKKKGVPKELGEYVDYEEIEE